MDLLQRLLTPVVASPTVTPGAGVAPERQDPPIRPEVLLEARRRLREALELTLLAPLWDGDVPLADAPRRRLMGTLVTEAQADARRAGEDRDRGVIPPIEWVRRFTEVLWPLHVAAGMAGAGREQFAAAEWTVVDAAIARQAGYLERFARLVLGGSVPPGAGFLARGALYMASAWSTSENVRRAGAMLAGRTEERRFLGLSEHCKDCVDEAEKGWQPIGTLRRIGDSACHVHCKCTFGFR